MFLHSATLCLQDFVPQWCANSIDDSSTKLGIRQWIAAFDRCSCPRPRAGIASRIYVLCRYSLAAEADGQWSFVACLAHKDIVLRVSARASAKKRSPYLGLIYDAIARRVGHVLFYVHSRTCVCVCAFQEWSERSAANEDGFSVDVVSTMLHEELLLSAEAEYDLAEAAKSKKVPILFYLLRARFLAPCAQADNQAHGHKTHNKGYGESFALRAKIFCLLAFSCLCRQGIWQRQSQRCQRLRQRRLRKSKRLWQRQGQGRPLHDMKCCTRCRRLRFGHGGYLTIEGHVALHMLSHMWGHFMFAPPGR